MAKENQGSRKRGKNSVCQRDVDAVHRQDEADETERTGIPGTTPEEVEGMGDPQADAN